LFCRVILLLRLDAVAVTVALAVAVAAVTAASAVVAFVVAAAASAAADADALMELACGSAIVFLIADEEVVASFSSSLIFVSLGGAAMDIVDVDVDAARTMEEFTRGARARATRARTISGAT
jgi:hypothetical protein